MQALNPTSNLSSSCSSILFALPYDLNSHQPLSWGDQEALSFV